MSEKSVIAISNAAHGVGRRQQNAWERSFGVEPLLWPLLEKAQPAYGQA